MAKSKTVPAWINPPAKFPGKLCGAKGSDFCEAHTLALEAWGEAAAADNSGLTAFAYLWRRFGPSPHGSDSHKDYVAYILGTPMKGVFLELDLSASPLSYAAGYLMLRSFERDFYGPQGNWWMKCFRLIKTGVLPKDPGGEETEAWHRAAERKIGRYPKRQTSKNWQRKKGFVHDLNAALFAAMRELLRPVRVRDVAINIFGRCEFSDHEAEPSDLAGYGVPVDVMRKRVEKWTKRG